MVHKRYIVDLTHEEREQLLAFIAKGRASARALLKARILLLVAKMEDILEVYTRPHDKSRPLVCLDETSKQLIAETRTPIPMKPGQPARYDYEYKRGGVQSLDEDAGRYRLTSA
jgi:hypothetical protein